MTEHSKLPWKRLPASNYEYFLDADGNQIAWWPAEGIPRIVHTNNALLMLDSVNALAGLKPEKVKALVEAVERWYKAMETHGYCTCEMPLDLCEAEEVMLTALAEVKVEK